MNKRKKRKLDKENKLERMVLKTYYDFSNPGSYGGLERLHKTTCVPVKKLKSIMRKNLIYSLHKPVRIRYTRNPTVANSINHQWAADLADMKNLSRYNKGVKYLLTVVDVLSKYAWVVPMKNKTGAEQKRAFESILKKGESRYVYKRIKEVNFTTNRFKNISHSKRSLILILKVIQKLLSSIWIFYQISQRL